jgi:serine phosphatase RsbU (regulator of sigma subunit)
VVTIPARSTLLAFTDGLVERRGENLEVGLQRLAEVAVADRPVDELLETIIATLHSPSSEDDVAVLALHWTT